MQAQVDNIRRGIYQGRSKYFIAMTPYLELLLLFGAFHDDFAIKCGLLAHFVLYI
jgi:hypothetical protein